MDEIWLLNFLNFFRCMGNGLAKNEHLLQAVHAINSSEFWSFLNVENSLSNLMARMLSLLTFCTQSLHWRNAPTNADTKRSKAVNSSFPSVFNMIALAKAASGFIMLDEILSRTEISSLTVKLLVDCRKEGDAWSSLSTSVSSKLRINWSPSSFAATAILLHNEIFKTIRVVGGSQASHILQGAWLVSPPFLIDALLYTDCILTDVFWLMYTDCCILTAVYCMTAV